MFFDSCTNGWMDMKAEWADVYVPWMGVYA